MSNYPSPFGNPVGRRPEPLGYATSTPNDAAIRFFNAVYGWMAAGLAITAVVAWWVSLQPQLMRQIFSGPTLLILIVVELALVWTISGALNRINATAATTLFVVYSALNGVTLSAILLVYTAATLTSAFAVAAGTFAVVSVYGMVTRRDLSGLGSILFMGLIGIILASIVSVFIHNTMLDVAINYIGVALFVGLTAYDTQRMKVLADQTAGSPTLAARLAIVGALRLYLDFINLFLFILQAMGRRR